MTNDLLPVGWIAQNDIGQCRLMTDGEINASKGEFVRKFKLHAEVDPGPRFEFDPESAAKIEAAFESAMKTMVLPHPSAADDGPGFDASFHQMMKDGLHLVPEDHRLAWLWHWKVTHGENPVSMESEPVRRSRKLRSIALKSKLNQLGLDEQAFYGALEVNPAPEGLRHSYQLVEGRHLGKTGRAMGTISFKHSRAYMVVLQLTDGQILVVPPTWCAAAPVKESGQ